MDASARKHTRKACPACHCEILEVNGVEAPTGETAKGLIENISRGGFRFRSGTLFELEDRLVVRIYFTDGHTHDSEGRICYCDDSSDRRLSAYGFSVIKGFYSL